MRMFLLRADSVDVQDVTIQDAVRHVLEDPEFRHLTRKRENFSNDYLPEWLKSFLEWLFNWLQSDSATKDSKASFSGLDGILYFLAIAIVAGIVIFLVVSLLKRIKRQEIDRPFELSGDTQEINPLTPPGEYPTAVYEQRAMQFAASGDFRAAIRELALGGMSWVERSGRIRYRRGLTNRDYIRAVWSDRERRLSLIVIAEAFDRIFFGRRRAEQGGFEACLMEFQQSFRETIPG